MTLTHSLVPLSLRRPLWISACVAAAVALSFAFNCAAPLAAFAAIAALTMNSRREALALTAAIWFANQAVGFLFLNYPTGGSTLAWGGAMGVIALISCEAAALVWRRVDGLAGAAAAFLAAFVVYKALIFGFGAAMGSSAGHVDSLLTTLPRIFLINACAFAALGALHALGVA